MLRVSAQVADASALTTAGVVTSGPRLSVAAAAVIAHEVGHALQDHDGDPAMKLRQAIVPAAQFGSGIAPWLILAGLFTQITGLAIVGLIGFAGAVLFTFATLPVEIGASGKALAFVNGLGMVGREGDGRTRGAQGSGLDVRGRRARRVADLPVLRVPDLRTA